MKNFAAILAGILLAGAAGAGDVYVTKDAQGHAIYTDTPQTLPAQKVTVLGQGTSQAAAAQQSSSEMAQYKKQDQAFEKAEAQQAQAAQAAESSAADRVKRCADARQQYQSVMSSRRLYEEGPDGERNYLTSEQIDKARADAKQVMDQFCTDQ
jgi:erythromycin esterase-like protein